MTEALSEETLQQAVQHELSALAVPAFDFAAIRAQAPALAQRSSRRRLATVLCLAGAVLAGVLGSSAAALASPQGGGGAACARPAPVCPQRAAQWQQADH